VDAPLKKFTNLTGKDGYLTTHLQRQYHLSSVVAAHEAKSMCSNRSDVTQQVNRQAEEEIRKNREQLERIIEGILLLGRMGLPLHGHRDSGSLPATDEIDFSQGNFRALLQFMIVKCNDQILKQHVLEGPKNATYISALSQNDVIVAVDVAFSKRILMEVKDFWQTKLLMSHVRSSCQFASDTSKMEMFANVLCAMTLPRN
jgi:hypothetical protein